MGYRSYFSEEVGSTGLAGTGLANYSNRGFYSAGTNAFSGGAFWYASPAPKSGEALNIARIPPERCRNAAEQLVR